MEEVFSQNSLVRAKKLQTDRFVYCSAPKAIHRKAALGILAYINGTSGFGITFQRGTITCVSLEIFAEANYASKANDTRSVSGGAIMSGGACV